MAMVVLPLVLAGIIIAAAQVYNDRQYAQAPGWSEFYEFNKLRVQFTDYERATYDWRTAPAFQTAGWSRNDALMLKEWLFADANVYSKENLARVLEHIPALSPRSSEGVLLSVRDNIEADPANRMFLAGALLPLLFVSWRKHTISIAALSLWLAVLAAVLLILLFKRLPPWVMIPLLGFTPSLALVLPACRLAWGWNTHPRLSLQIVGLILLALYTWEALAWERQRSEAALDQSRILQAAIQSLRPTPNQLYVAWGWHLFPFDLILSARDLEGLAPLKLLGPGYLLRSPIDAGRLAEFGIADLNTAIYKNKNVFVISRPSYNPLLVRYTLEHHGKTIAPRQVFQVALGVTPFYLHVFQQTVKHFRQFTVYQFAEVPAGSEIEPIPRNVNDQEVLPRGGGSSAPPTPRGS
jgi:hypothetical protein